MRTRLLVGLLALGTTLSSASACSRASEANGEVAPSNMIGVHIQNDNFVEMDIYAIADGLPTRLGSVKGSSSRDFTLDPSLGIQDLRIVAAPLNGNGRSSTGPISVGPGQTIDFKIGPTRKSSSVVIR